MNLALIVFFLSFVIVFLLRIPIALGMMLSSIFYFALSANQSATIDMVATQFLSNMNSSFLLIAVPLFVFMAEVMNSGKITSLIFSFANALVGKRKGALGHVNIVASIIFSGMTGSALADAAGVGNMSMKAMKEHGYDDGYTAALTAAGAVIGPIIPPSIPMIFYSMLSGASVGALFLGGILPGLCIGFALMGYNAYISNKRNYPAGQRLPFRQFAMLTFKSFPALFSVLVLLGGIYGGVVTPTEAGAFAAFYALIVSVFFYRAFGFSDLKTVVFNTVKTIGTLSLLVGCSFAFSYIITIEKIPDVVANLLFGITHNKYIMLLIINIIFLILGMFIDTMPITLVFIPIVLPLIRALGIDPVHFGVVIVVNMMIGLCTPPYGMLLFVVSGLTKTPLKSIIKEITPMIIVLIIVLFILTYVPEIVLFVPHLAGYKS
jgi:tripartite ATP-independent transporter DctM subunit